MDGIFEEVGECGQYQIVVALLLTIAGCFPSVFIAYSQVFVSASPDHWCLVPELIGLDLLVAARKNLSIPRVLKDGILRHSQCEMFAINYSHIASIHQSNLNGLDEMMVTGDLLPQQKCIHGWEYDHSDYDATLVTDFNLVCEQNWWPSFCTSLFYAGGILGNLFFGWISDRFGRKIAFHLNLFFVVTLPVASAFSPNYLTFTIFRFLIGFQFPAMFQIPFIIALEITSSKYRTAMGMVIALVFGLAICVLSGIAYLVRHWFALTLVTSTPFAIMLFYWWLIPESPRWLISQNRLDEAERNLQQIAKVNKKRVPVKILSKYQVQDQLNVIRGSSSPSTLFHTPNLCKKTVLIMFMFITNAMCYTGLNYMSANLGVSDYLAFAISGFVEAPSCLLAWYAMEKWGRRWTTLFTMILVGICCAGNVFVPEDYSPAKATIDILWLNVLLPSLGKFFITGSFSIVYVYGGELIPTVVRGRGLGLCAVVSGLGNIVIPYIVYLVKYSRVLPLVIMGCMSIVGGIGAIFLPETLHAELPETLEEGEEFGRNMKYFSWLPKNMPVSQRRTEHDCPQKSDVVNGLL